MAKALEFFKLFNTFFTGSISEEELHTRIVFLGMCSMSNEDGLVEAVPSAIARYCNVKKEHCLAALGVLMAPDPHSTTEEHEGRRVLSIGTNRWQVVNKRQYMEKGKAAGSDRTEYMREYMKKRRQDEREAKGVNVNVNKSTNASSSSSVSKSSGKGEGESLEGQGFGPEFIRLANAYPKRPGGQGLSEAAEILAEIVDVDCVDPEAIIAGAERYAAYWNTKPSSERKFIKTIPNWLKGKCWLEDYGAGSVKPENGVDYHMADVDEHSKAGEPSAVGRFFIEDGQKTRIPFDEDLWRERKADPSIPLVNVNSVNNEPVVKEPVEVTPEHSGPSLDTTGMRPLEIDKLQRELPRTDPVENVDFYWRAGPKSQGEKQMMFAIIGGMKTGQMFDEKLWREMRGG